MIWIISICIGLYVIFTFVLLFGWQRIPAFYLKNTFSQAKISVIIPVRNESKHILLLLEDIAQQSYKNFELIVIDDASDDGTLDILQQYALQAPYPFQVLSFGQNSSLSGKKQAIAQGIARHTGATRCGGLGSGGEVDFVEGVESAP